MSNYCDIFLQRKMELFSVAGDHQKQLALHIFTNGVQESSQGIGTKSAFKKTYLRVL